MWHSYNKILTETHDKTSAYNTWYVLTERAYWIIIINWQKFGQHHALSDLITLAKFLVLAHCATTVDAYSQEVSTNWAICIIISIPL